jgi:hypothetical protein
MKKWEVDSKSARKNQVCSPIKPLAAEKNYNFAGLCYVCLRTWKFEISSFRLSLRIRFLMPKDKEKNLLLKLLRIETQMMDEMQEIITNCPRIFACSLIGRH